MASLAALNFEPAELAYLALSSKPEGQVRDRLAWALHKAGCPTMREWGRRDLAVWINGRPEGTPTAVVELKACHTYDLCANRRWLPSELAKDIAKARTLPSDVEAFLLVVVTHLEFAAGEKPVGVKYARKADPAEAAASISAQLQVLAETSEVPLGDGEALGVRANVTAWLCGPLRNIDERRVPVTPILSRNNASTSSDAIDPKRTQAASRLNPLLSAAGFEVRENRGGKYHPVYYKGQRLAEVQRRADGREILWLRRPDRASTGLFMPTTSATWKGGRCEVSEETIGG